MKRTFDVYDDRVVTHEKIGDTTVHTTEYNASPTSVFKIVIMLLLMVAIMRVCLGSTQLLTFGGLLQALQNAPSVDISWLRSFVAYGNSLSQIPIIGGGLAFLTNLVSAALFGAIGVIQIALYTVWIVGYLF